MSCAVRHLVTKPPTRQLTNVSTLFSLLSADPKEQMCYYQVSVSMSAITDTCYSHVLYTVGVGHWYWPVSFCDEGRWPNST